MADPKSTQKMREFIEQPVNELANNADFSEYLGKLLSTFMPEEHVRIYLSNELEPQEQSFLPDAHTTSNGPMDIMSAAFVNRYVSELNLETLESLGDNALDLGINLFIQKNFPHIRTVGVIDGMKKWFAENRVIAVYAEMLGFTIWARRVQNMGLTQKDKGDLFESFIGAIVLAGEWYIGDGIGTMYAMRFIAKFYSLVEWNMEDLSMYVTPSQVYNNYKLVAYPTPLDEPKANIDSTGVWRAVILVSGPAIKERTGGQETVEGNGTSSTKKKVALEAAWADINKQLGISESIVAELRAEKRKSAVWITAIQTLRRLSEEHGKTYSFGTVVSVRDAKVVFISEDRELEYDGQVLKYRENIVQGIGFSEDEAVQKAIDKMSGARPEYMRVVQGSTLDLGDPAIMERFAKHSIKGTGVSRDGDSVSWMKRNKKPSDKSGKTTYKKTNKSGKTQFGGF